jgi:purine-nucleoside phosphorylase
MNGNHYFTYDDFKQAADYIYAQIHSRPEIGLILGSGLSPLAEQVEDGTAIAYQDIPNFPQSGVAGHAGRLVCGTLAGKLVLIMQGRSHFYEGYSAQHITFPVRVLQLLGVNTLIVTNAAGGVNPGFSAGDLMLIVDHLNFVGMTGAHPLRGPNLDSLGPRFPSMTAPYDPELLKLARQVSRESDVSLQEGVYAYLSGPSFETPAEIRYLRGVGADAVGMSTVPETIVANHGGMRVLGISSITNVAVSENESGQETTHQEVLETGRTIVPRLMKLLKAILSQL